MYLFERYIRWYFHIFQQQFANDSIGVSDVIAEATHFFALAAAAVPAIAVLILDIVQILPSASDEEEKERSQYTVVADALLVAYLLTVLVMIIARRNIPQVSSRQPLYVVSCVVGELYCLFFSWANGTNNEFYLSVVAVVTVAVVLNVSWGGIVVLNTIYIIFLVLRSYELAWGTPDDPTFYKFYEVKSDPAYSFVWYLLTNYVPFILIVLLSVYMSEALRVERNRMQRTLEIVDRSAQLMGSMKLEEANSVLQQSVEADVYVGVVEVLRGICTTLAVYRPFLPDALLGDDNDPLDDPVEIKDVDDDSSVTGTNASANPGPGASMNSSKVSSAPSASQKTTDGSAPTTDGSNVVNVSGTTPAGGFSAFHERKFMTALSSRTIVILTVQDKTHDDMTEVDGAVLFLNTVVATIKRCNGLVQSYRGGTVVATWTRTRQVARPHVSAVRAAVMASQTLLKDHNIQTHIGIDVSPCVVGNVGTSSLLMFNELRGPAVEGSLALCTLCGVLDAQILISEAVHKESKFSCIGRSVGYTSCTDIRRMACTLSTMSSGVQVYEIVDLRCSEKDKGDGDEWMYQLEQEEKVLADMAVFEKGVQLYASGSPEEASAVFQGVLESRGDDRVVKKYISLCTGATS
eukprot:PhM_4_TR15553/c0_g1_i1/m.48233